MSGCAECSGPLGVAPKSAIFLQRSLSGRYSAHNLCADCWQAAQQLGGPGPNTAAAARSQADAAIAAAKRARGY